MNTAESGSVVYRCDITGKEQVVRPNKRGVTPIPRGWKRHDGLLYSAEAWGERWVMRAVTIPVHEVVDCEWPEFAAALHRCWAQVTRLQNWLLTTMYAHDCLTAPIDEDGKLPKAVVPYLYLQTEDIAPDVMSQNRSAIERQVWAKYRSSRFAVRARNNDTLASYRYPQPMPVVASAWHYVDGDRTKISVPLAGRRYTIQLRKGKGSRRALQALAVGVPAELSLLAKNTGEPQGLSVVIKDKRGQSTRRQVMCKIALWLPRKQAETSGVLRVRTDPQSLLVALNDRDERLWTYNGDHIRRLVAQRLRRVQRLSEDRKLEERQPMASYQSRADSEVDRYRRKMDSITHQVAAFVVNYADRRRLAELRYDDSDKSFVERFPYHELKSKIQQKCERAGIVYTEVKAEAAAETAEA